MSLETIRAECERQITNHGEDAHVILVLPIRLNAKVLGRRRIAGREGPIGDSRGECERGEIVDFKARDVLAWLDRP
jgi:hypothetical protein